jgi:hypothetical protein
LADLKPTDRNAHTLNKLARLTIEFWEGGDRSPAQCVAQKWLRDRYRARGEGPIVLMPMAGRELAARGYLGW